MEKTLIITDDEGNKQKHDFNGWIPDRVMEFFSQNREIFGLKELRVLSSFGLFLIEHE